MPDTVTFSVDITIKNEGDNIDHLQEALEAALLPGDYPDAVAWLKTVVTEVSL